MLKLDQNYNEYNKYDNINYVKYHYLYNSNNNICDISYRRHNESHPRCFGQGRRRFAGLCSVVPREISLIESGQNYFNNLPNSKFCRFH